MNLCFHVCFEIFVVLSNHVSGRVILADQHESFQRVLVGAIYSCTSHGGCLFPDELREMACFFGESCGPIKVIHVSLISPSVDCAGDIGIA